MTHYPRIVNLHTGQVTPLRIIWSEDMNTCERCPECHTIASNEIEERHIREHGHCAACAPETCRYCTEPVPDDEDDDIDWVCDECSNAWDDLWFNRSHEAQDRAVLRGMG